MRYPIHAYQNAGSNCAIVGATFYRPQIFRFPPAYAGRYFFGDFCGGFIRMLSPPNYSSSAGFATGISSLVDIQTHHDGSLYYLARGGGELFRVQSTTSTIVFNDNFESARGWTLTGGANSATRGLWQRGDPEPTINAGMPLQLGNCQGSTNCLITGLAAGTWNGANDVDDGQTSIQSPAIALPAGRPLTLAFGLYFAHNARPLQRTFSACASSVRTASLRPCGREAALRATSRAPGPRAPPISTPGPGKPFSFASMPWMPMPGSLIEAGVDNVAITAH